MKQLQISLTGKINSTNFDAWKSELIERIQSVNQNLVTDADFSQATQDVKSFKAAEKALKDAKQSAINQAQEIQRLFSSIDEVTEEARQARLSLERQIKTRKQEIKEEYIQAGIDEIKAVIGRQSECFRNCDLTRFLDRSRYDEAVRGARGIPGLETGINKATSAIKEEIEARAIIINNNKVKLDSIVEGYKVLFQDEDQLVCLPGDQLESEIDKRIARYESEIKARKEQPPLPPEESPSEEDVGDVKNLEEVGSAKSKYRIVIHLNATSEEAEQIQREINTKYSAWVREIALYKDN